MAKDRANNLLAFCLRLWDNAVEDYSRENVMPDSLVDDASVSEKKDLRISDLWSGRCLTPSMQARMQRIRETLGKEDKLGKGKRAS